MLCIPIMLQGELTFQLPILSASASHSKTAVKMPFSLSLSSFEPQAFLLPVCSDDVKSSWFFTTCTRCSFVNWKVLSASNYFQQWGLVFRVVSIQTPDPAVRPISHFHSCSSPCGLHLKIAKRGERRPAFHSLVANLSLYYWWEDEPECTCMTIQHISNACTQTKPVLTNKRRLL